MSGVQPHVSHYLHGGGTTVVLDWRCAAWLLERAKLRELRIQARGHDPAIDAQLLALTIAGMKWADSVNGNEPRKVAEIVPPSEWMDTKEVATVLEVTESRVRQLLRDQRIVGQQRCRRWRIHRTELEHYRTGREAS